MKDPEINVRDLTRRFAQSTAVDQHLPCMCRYGGNSLQYWECCWLSRWARPYLRRFHCRCRASWRRANASWG